MTITAATPFPDPFPCECEADACEHIARLARTDADADRNDADEDFAAAEVAR